MIIIGSIGEPGAPRLRFGGVANKTVKIRLQDQSEATNYANVWLSVELGYR